MTSPSAPSAGEAQVLLTAVRDLGVRAFHTFWQSAVATAGTLYAASGLDAHEIASVGGLEKLAVVVVGGAGAAGLSAVKTLVLTYHTSKKAVK